MFAAALFLAPPVPVISGVVTYRERFAVPNDSEVVVSLDRRSDGRTVTVSSTTLRTEGRQVPFSFVLPIPRQSRASERYDLRAKIVTGGRTIFATPSPVALPSGAIARTNVTLRLVRQASLSDGAITGVEWSLVELEGQPVDESGPRLKLEAGSNRMTGSGGVNTFSGTYVLEGDRVQLDPGATTRMAGTPEAMRAEFSYFRALERVTRAALRDGELVLYRGDRAVMTFERL